MLEIIDFLSVVYVKWPMLTLTTNWTYRLSMEIRSMHSSKEQGDDHKISGKRDEVFVLLSTCLYTKIKSLIAVIMSYTFLQLLIMSILPHILTSTTNGKSNLILMVYLILSSQPYAIIVTSNNLVRGSNLKIVAQREA